MGQHERVEISSGRRAGFVVLGLIATASLLVAGFCGIRWSLIDVNGSTEVHVADFRRHYSELTPAELIREYERMEEVGIELAGPYKYKRAERKRNGWGRNASIAAAVGGLAILGAFAITASGRRNQS